MSGVWPVSRRFETRIVLVVLALAGAVLGVSQPLEAAAGERRQGVALMGRGGPEQVVTRASAVGSRLLVEPREPAGRAGPPVLYGLLLFAAVLVGAARLDWTARPVWQRLLVDRTPAALGSRAPPSQRT